MVDHKVSAGGIHNMAPPSAPARRGEHDVPLKFLTLEELSERTPPGYLIDGVLPKESLAVVFGPPKCSKTFLVLDWLLSIASGQAWCGRAVERGTVVYVAAEGVARLSQRIDAWCAHRGVERSSLNFNFLIVEEPLQLAESERIDELIALCKLHRCSIVAFDTLARCALGIEENSATEIGLLINGCDRVKRELHASVVLVHHAGRDKTSVRGSSAIDGAADTMVQVRRTKSGVNVSCFAQKDDEPFEAMDFELSAVDVFNSRLEPGSSCVLTPRGRATRLNSSTSNISPGDVVALEAICATAATKECSASDISETLGTPRGSFARVLNRLEKAGYINTRVERRNRVVLATPPGAAFVANLVASGRTESHATTVESRPTSHTLGSLKGPEDATKRTTGDSEPKTSANREVEVGNAS